MAGGRRHRPGRLPGERVTIACLTSGERGESAKAWREGRKLDEIKAIRRDEAERAAATLGAEVRFLDAGDYPLVATAELTDRLVAVYRETQPDVVVTHPTEAPYSRGWRSAQWSGCPWLTSTASTVSAAPYRSRRGKVA